MSINENLYPWVLSAALLLSTGPAVSFADNRDDVTSDNMTPDISNVIMPPSPAAENIKDMDMEDPDPFSDADGIYFFHQAMGKAWEWAGNHINETVTLFGVEKMEPIILQSSAMLGSFDALYVPEKNRLILGTTSYQEYDPENYESRAEAMESLTEAMALDLIVLLDDAGDIQSKPDSIQKATLFKDYSSYPLEETQHNDTLIDRVVERSDMRLVIYLHQLRQKENKISPE
jgi:hypothetical protein